MVFWTAGVKTSDFISKLNVEKTGQGRIKVDEFLRLKDGIFVVGDAAGFLYKKMPLRMAVQFSILQGRIAGANVINTILNKPLIKYNPKDLGYVIPMANNKSCSKILGLNLKGVFPTILHYFMCIYRSYGLYNKFGILKDLTKGG